MNDKKIDNLLLDVSGLKSALSIGTHAAYSLMRSDSFPSFKIGSRYYVSSEFLKQWIKEQSLNK